MQKIHAIIFDLYGTLYDVHSVAHACEDAYPGHGAAIARLWRQTQMDYTWLRSLMERYADFETVTEDALRFTCAKLGLALLPGTARQLSDQYLHLNPHPDMPPALRRLRDAGVPMLIASNGSRRTISQVVSNSGMKWAFDQFVSVDDVEVFKPHRKIYLLAEQRAGHPRENILYVSANGWDASAASLFGFPVCWVNRDGGPLEELGAAPTVVVPDLAAMADWMLALR
ncbi:haloacid dehalogenase type II [Massilia violaceinigra]|uniref:(S)-2-haloacid dehalogenase n=1 Tax=Massilia violaceinigra TaxID=2045208 RepID=A0A2D2DSN8_9BURK|nr:haloacid dehalogenase type II [Massilia violaceinigra]ATQ77991.1 haloacid dehalogenase type II [Massilia violaceinigra]